MFISVKSSNPFENVFICLIFDKKFKFDSSNVISTIIVTKARYLRNENL
jgi:hypothetical protein